MAVSTINFRFESVRRRLLADFRYSSNNDSLTLILINIYFLNIERQFYSETNHLSLYFTFRIVSTKISSSRFLLSYLYLRIDLFIISLYLFVLFIYFFYSYNVERMYFVNMISVLLEKLKSRRVNNENLHVLSNLRFSNDILQII